ncbi:MAG: DUF1499 domain-containing protein [Pseudomonadota bacterium]
MSEVIDTPKAGWRMKVAIFALCVSIFTALWMTVAALGTKFGWWHYQVGLLQMTAGIGGPLAFFGFAFGIIAQIIALIKFPRKQAFIVALAATLISLAMAGRLVAFRSQAMAVPPIHDIQTDWSDPIAYSDALLQVREADGAENDASQLAPRIDDDRIPEPIFGRLVSEVQEEAELTEGSKGTVYPTLEPLYFSQSPDEIATITERILRKRGWKIVTPAPVDGNAVSQVQLEATETSGWFGFKDDVAVRIRPSNGATRVDIRSTSRVGLSDLGANSARVYSLMVELEDRGDGRRAP